MKIEEFQKIKESYQEYKDLLVEQDYLRNELETRVDTYNNLCKLAQRLEEVEFDLFSIHNEEDIYVSLADSNEFERIQCDTEKKLYFFYGFIKKDPYQSDSNRWGDDYIIFVPRYTRFSTFDRYYVMLWDLVDARGTTIIPLKKYEQFKKDNYVYEINEEIDIPYLDASSYNRMRHSCFGGTDNYEEAYNQLRVELFKNYVHCQTEEEAVTKLAKKHIL